MKILLITGPASEAQGWGDAETTQRIRAAIEDTGKEVRVLDVATLDDLMRGLDKIRVDLAWSSIYQVSDNAAFIGLNHQEPWVMDILEDRGIPYVGSSVSVLKTMLDKSKTRDLLAKHGLAVPRQQVVELGDAMSLGDAAAGTIFPAFVKPRYESQSAGISEQSIVHSHDALMDRVRYIHAELEQCALVEEYLPGAELTVSFLGKGPQHAEQFHAVVNRLDPSSYVRYPVIMTDIQDVLHLELANGLAGPAEALAARAVTALGCRDHVRVDMREDQAGDLKIIEVNGIPGLTPNISRSCEIHRLNNSSLEADESYHCLINSIVDTALHRTTTT